MKMNFFESILLAGMLGCCSGARAGETSGGAPRPSILPIQSAVEVKEVKGTVEYAYDGTGWRTLAPGKLLKPGATVRASTGAVAILRVDERSSLCKVSAATKLHITTQTPAEEQARPVLAAACLGMVPTLKN